MTSEQTDELAAFVESHLDNLPLFAEWFSLPVSVKYSSIVSKMIDLGKAAALVARYVLSQPHWKRHSELLLALIMRGTAVLE